MSRTLSTAALAAVHAQGTDAVFTVLLTIEVPDSTPIYLTWNSENIISRGRTYVAFPFSLELPSDENGQISEVKLSIDNVSRDLVDEVRGLSDPLQLTIEVVLTDSPDTIEYVMEDYTLRQLTYDALTISGTLSQENYFSEPYPKDVMSGALYPGQF